MFMDAERWRPALAVGLLLALMAASPSSGLASPIGSDLLAEEMAEALDLFIEGAGGGDLPVIVIFRDGADREAKGLHVKRSFRVINGVSGTISPEAFGALGADPDVLGVYPDGSVVVAQPANATPDDGGFCATERVNAKPLWDLGIDGAGVVVAVLDSGIDKNHPDLAGKVVGEVNFVDSERTTDDLLGHGTAVAGIIAGSGTASGGRYTGVAPGASLLNVRVIDSKGSGQISDIIAGIDWAIDNGAHVLSMSLGGLNLGESNPPISMAADNAMDAGTVVCVAAGNLDERLLLLMLVASSVCFGCVESPGDGVKVITVGATDCDDRIAAFSGSGPLRDGRYKPTLVAPGVNVVTTVPQNLDIEGKIAGYYAATSGTSLSTPVVAGVAALLLQAEPGITPAGVKAALTGGAKKLDNTQGEEYEAYYQGAGLVDAGRSLDLLHGDRLSGALPDRWTAGRWVYGDFWIAGDSTVYGSLDTGADRFQKKIYALAPGDVDWSSKFLFFTDRELSDVTTSASGDISDWTSVQPLPRGIPANGQRIFGAAVSVPHGAESGRYEGSIDISENGTAIFSIPVTIDVAEAIEMVTGRGSVAGTIGRGGWDYYYVSVPVSTDELKSTLRWGGDCDLDLFLLSPTSEYYPAGRGEGQETVSVEAPSTGRWMMAVHPRNITGEVDYVLEVERTLLATTPRRWAVGSATPGETKDIQFTLRNGGPSLANVTYLGMTEVVEKARWSDSIGDKVIWTVPIEVPANASRLGVRLAWADPDTDLALLLFNQDGRAVDVSYSRGVQEVVGANHPAPGIWRAIVYGYHVRTRAREPFDLEATFYVQDSWSWISATGPDSLGSGAEQLVNATITVPSDAPSSGVEGYIQIRADEDRFSIPVTVTVAGASLTGESRIDLIDEDGDGLYERLCIQVGVDVISPGEYRVEGSLVDGNGTYIGWLGDRKELAGSGSIEICVNGSEIWRKGTCGPLRLENLFLYSGAGDIIDRYHGNVTVFKCPQDFQPISARFTGEFVDEMVATPSQVETKPDAIVIAVGVAVQHPGSYEVSGRLVDDDGFEIYRTAETVILEAGVHTVPLSFSPLKFIMKNRPSRLHLVDLTLSLHGETIETREKAFSTGLYRPRDISTVRDTYVISSPVGGS
ncbi:MAG: Peptidase families S8 and S53 protein [Methanothrix sp.]|jgi:serine protease AprX|nr:MAG: Peptidase families S8 and S53 protein [Methanothrix sp.]